MTLCYLLIKKNKPIYTMLHQPKVQKNRSNRFFLQVVIALFCIVIITTVSSCKKDTAPNSKNTNDQPVTSTALGDGLSSEENAILEESGGSNEILKKLRGADGKPLQKTTATPKEQLINAILSEARSLINQKDYLAHDALSYNEPFHMGIAYLWGGKDWSKRNYPSKNGSNSIHQQYAVHGLDCSGFIVHLLNGVGIFVNSQNTNTGNLESNLRKTLKDYKNEDFALGLLNLKWIPEKEMKDGDIILWNGHVGLIAKTTDDTTLVLQSNGTGTPKSEEDQAKNLGPKRGVRYCTFQEITSRSFKGNNYQILRLIASGDTLFGGIVFYIDETGKHGKVCALEDQTSHAEWYVGSDTYVPGTQTGIGSGKSNTDLLINAFGNASIANYCTNYSYAGYNDWYLPSKDELVKMWVTLAKYNVGNFSNTWYASSSDNNKNAFWSVSFDKNFSYGTAGTNLKRFVRSSGIDYHYYAARAIRDF